MRARAGRMRCTALGAVLLAILSLVTACSGSGSQAPAAGCRSLCTGTIDDSEYAIRVPAHWNGTLLLYAHGFALGGFSALPHLTSSDIDGDGRDPLSTTLLAQGYALAGASYPTRGWTIDGAVTSEEQLHARFVALIGRPEHVIVWGSSMGGLIVELLAERESWVDAAAPMCGVMAGSLPNIDLWTRTLALARTITGSDVPIAPRDTPDQLGDLAAQLTAELDAVRDSGNGGAPALLSAAWALGLPERSAHHLATTLTNRLGAAAENVAEAAHLSIDVLSDVDARYGPDAGDARLSAVSLGLTAQRRADLRALRVGDVTALRDYLIGAGAPSVDPTARASLDRTGVPTYRLRVPTISLHTEVDPDVIVANETRFRDGADATGTADLLRQAYIAEGPTPDGFAGAGHCRFTTAQQVGLVGALDRWMRTRVAPSTADLVDAVGADPSFTPPAWPS